MKKYYSINEIFKLDEETKFKTVATDNMNHESIVMVKNGILFHEYLLDEWHECLLTENWLNTKYTKLDD